jgi:hypothetical protein
MQTSTNKNAFTVSVLVQYKFKAGFRFGKFNSWFLSQFARLPFKQLICIDSHYFFKTSAKTTFFIPEKKNLFFYNLISTEIQQTKNVDSLDNDMTATRDSLL